ncbi:GAF and ANTAR domain-containing protein [Ammonicoccus fulvus]|uniref:GAF and ANTAR domain-containing protein n=1 Tax=Ammonicoccus fulvus TaxID=3138240 RepID=A0ABZ3FNH5_9ACTN
MPETSLAGVLNELVLGDPTIEQVLDRVLDLAMRLIPHVDGASITLFRADMKPYTLRASDEWVRTVDKLQYELLQGPCIEVAATSAPTSGSADLASSTDWPVFGPAASEAGVRSLLAAGLSAHPDPNVPTSPPGALNLYSRHSAAFTAEEREEALLLAAIAGIGVQLVAARNDVERLREALSSRDVIGQAKGILMERHGVDDAAAFTILRRASNDLNVKLRDVAAELAASAGLAPDVTPRNGSHADRPAKK